MKVFKGIFVEESGVMRTACKILAGDATLIVFRSGDRLDYKFSGSLLEEVELIDATKVKPLMSEIFGDKIQELNVTWKH